MGKTKTKTQAQISHQTRDPITSNERVMNERINMNNNRITNLDDPIDNKNATNKQWVLAEIDTAIGVAFTNETIIYNGSIIGNVGGVTSQPWTNFRQLKLTGITASNITNELIIDTRSLLDDGQLRLPFYDGGVLIGAIVFTGTNDWFTSNTLGTDVSIIGIGNK